MNKQVYLFLIVLMQALCSCAAVSTLRFDVEFTHDNPLHSKKSITAVVLPQELNTPSDKLLKGDHKETHSLESVRESDESAEGSLASVEEIGAGVFDHAPRTMRADRAAVIAAARAALDELEHEERENISTMSQPQSKTWKEWFSRWWYGPEVLNLDLSVLSIDEIGLQAALDRKLQEYQLEHVDSEIEVMSKRIMIFELERLIELFHRSVRHLEDIEYKIECVEKELQTRTQFVKSRKRRTAIL